VGKSKITPHNRNLFIYPHYSKLSGGFMDFDEDKEDEEMNIDFSKIKNIFRRKKKSTEEAQKETKQREEIIKKEEKSAEETKEGEKEIKQTEKPAKETAEDEEISIDFKKIGGFFRGLKKGLKEESSEEKGDEEDVSLDIKKTVSFFKKYQKFIIPTLLIIIAMFFSIYLRVQPAILPATDDWATNSVHNQIRNSIKSQIDQQYPNLPEANKDSLVNAEFGKVLKEQEQQIDQQIEATSNYFKTRLQDDNGQTYLLAIDPYFWWRHAKNILGNGHPGDEIREGIPYDNHMYAPIGRVVPKDVFHAYFEAYLYKFIRFFNRDLDLMALIFYVPVILCALCIFPAFFIGKRLSNNLGGFVAAFIVAVHPAFLTRTAGGFADTDAYNVLFPLFITWLFLEAFETKDTKKIITLSALSGLFVGLFSFAWGGWWYIFDFILATSIIYVIFQLILHRGEIKSFIKKPAIKNTFILIITLFISSALFVSVFTGSGNFKNAFGGPGAFTRMKQVAITTVWPNVYTTVAEQNPASLDSVISQMGIGSAFLLLIAFTGMSLTTLRKKTKRMSALWFFLASVVWFFVIIAIKPQNLLVFLTLISIPVMIKLLLIIKEKDKEVDIKAAILLILWLIATTYASTRGIRYLLLAVPAFGIALGVSFGVGYYYISRLISKGLHINEKVAKIIVMLLLLFLLYAPYKSAEATVTQEIPSMNDAWYSSLKRIDLESEPDAIINSWWDFGHWFKMIGDRAVTFDGTSQGSANAHWIGSVLLADDEAYSVGVLRMVDCGQNQAFDELNQIINDTPESIRILEKIVRLNKEEAKKYLLKEGLNEEQSEMVLTYTHCSPPENYFITSYDMVSKSGVWAHFGAWNFERALIYSTLKKKEYKNDMEKSISFLQDRFNYTRETSENLYYEVQSLTDDKEANSWISPWPSYGGVTGCSKTADNKVGCGIGQGGVVEIDLETLQADIQTAQGIMHPNSVVLPLKDGTYKERFFNNTVGLSITLVPSGEESYSAIISNSELSKSMFTIMFYLNGHGLKYFEKFSDTTDITGGRIIVWKVNWEGKANNLVEYYQPKPVEEEIENESEEISEKESEIEPQDSSTNNSQDIKTLDNSSE